MTPTKRHPSFEKISFVSDAYLLQGVLHLPNAVRPPVVIGSHGLFSTGDSPKQFALAGKCNERGIAFFRFDHRGCGRSEGIFQEVTTLDARCTDLINAVEAVRARTDIGDKIGLFGSSMGGAVCIASAAAVGPDAIVTVAAPVRGSSVLEALEKSGANDLPEQRFASRYLRSDISDKLAGIHHILVFHGDADAVVPLPNAQEIFSNAREPKKLIVQKGGDHRMSNREHQRTFLAEAARWYRSCFDGGQLDAPGSS